MLIVPVSGQLLEASSGLEFTVLAREPCSFASTTTLIDGFELLRIHQGRRLIGEAAWGWLEVPRRYRCLISLHASGI